MSLTSERRDGTGNKGKSISLPVAPRCIALLVRGLRASNKEVAFLVISENQSPPPFDLISAKRLILIPIQKEKRKAHNEKEPQD